MRPRRLAVLAVLALAAPAAAPGPADAALTAADCGAAATERPFLPWLDPLNYVFAPDGGLEAGGDGWTLRGGATVVEGNERFQVHGAEDHQSLVIPAGGSAISPGMCVDLDRPVARFFARRTAGSLLSSMRVDVLYDGVTGELRATSLGVVTGGTDWAPTLPLPITANLLPDIGGGGATVAFRFTPVLGSWGVDDLYVDPYAKH